MVLQIEAEDSRENGVFSEADILKRIFATLSDICAGKGKEIFQLELALKVFTIINKPLIKI